MYLSSRAPRLAAAGISVVFLAALLCWPGTAQAQRFPPDPVNGLRRALRAPVRDMAARKSDVMKWVKALQTLGQMRQALALQEWRDEDPDPEVSAIDLPARADIAKRFTDGVRDIVQQGDPTAQLALASMLGEMGVTTRGIRTRSGFASQFAPDLVELINKGTPTVRAAAARALGLINPDPKAAVPALENLLHSDDPSLRIAAGDGLNNLIQVETQLTSRTRTATGVDATRADLVQVGQGVVSTAVKALTDSNADVRRRCAAAIREVAAALNRQVDVRGGEGLLDLGELGKQLEEERQVFWPLVEALASAAPALGRSLRDPEVAIRLLAAGALEDMSLARLVFLRRLGYPAPGENIEKGAAKRSPFQFVAAQKPPEKPPEDILIQGLRRTLPDMEAALSDPEASVRRATLDILETLGPVAAPVAPAVVRAMGDPGLFVRWAAARTIGKIGPVETATSVPALVRLLDDPDLDVNLAATTALSHYGPLAAAAVPELIAALKATDAEKRLAILHTLQSIGQAALPAIPAFAGELSDPDPRVRQAAAEGLAVFGPPAREAEPALRKALEDSNPEVRKAASDALLSILRSEAR